MKHSSATAGSYNFIDLFAGAGGLSEGFIQAGFSPVAHVEMNAFAAQTLETRTGYYCLKEKGQLDVYRNYIQGKISRNEFLSAVPKDQLDSVLCETMSDETLPGLFAKIDNILKQRGIEKVDVIIGGPPCQAYSLVGRAQSSHMGTPMSADPRNDLYKLYARFLDRYKPRLFVFENVMGIQSANGGETWKKVQESLRSVGYEIDWREQNSKDYGVLQNRRRIIIVGWLKDSGLSYPEFEKKPASAKVNDILSDLPALHPGEGANEYDSDAVSEYLRSTGIRKGSLYGRKETAQFPPNGFEIGDSFFIREIPVENDPFRRYVGICASGQSVKTALLRVYAIVLQAAYNLSQEEECKDYIDPYYTLVGYYNSIRELGGAVRLLQDDIPDRIQRIKKKYGMSKQRFLNHKVEITSRMSSYDIPKKLSQLEIPYTSKECLDTAIATNMIAVGMDVDRLGLMVVTGQPKQNSEYIQATSRIGRSFPGLVVTLYNPYRPRDLSHYENFTGYHSQLYRFVEGTTATPFSARARDRVLHALVISAIRLHYPNLANNDGAAAISELTDQQLDEIKALILNRLNIIKPTAKADAEQEIDDFICNWKFLAAQPKGLKYYVFKTEKYNRLMNSYGEVCTDFEKATLRSMREVESSANMYYYTEE